MSYRRFLVIAAALLTLVSPVAYADDQTSSMITADQLSLIRANCLRAQSSMTRLHANDALARVHLGQEYETISTKLMTPMNSRVVLDKYDGSAMIKTAAEFNSKLDQFRSLYRQYDEAIVRAIQMKCTDQPATFLDTLTQARDYRSAVRDSVQRLGELVQQYQGQVAQLRADITAQKAEGQN
jgi:hypothetical protein